MAPYPREASSPREASDARSDAGSDAGSESSGGSESVPRPVCAFGVGDVVRSPTEGYTLRRRIAHGTFSTVFEASREDAGGATCALKVLVPDDSSDTEVGMLKSISHPNVIRVLDAFHADRTQVVALPLYMSDLYEVVHGSGDGPPPLEHAKGYMRQLLAGLAACERAGVVHTDLKPENILLENASRHDVGLVVADFGSAVRTGFRARGYGHTLEYRSPEMIFEEKLGPASDVWTAATIAWELVTGGVLFSPRDHCRMDTSAMSSDSADGVYDAEHLLLMAELFGHFPRNIARRNRCFFSARGTLLGAPRIPRVRIEDALDEALGDDCPYTPDERRGVVDFVTPMLMYTPRRRVKASVHGAHPWLVPASGAGSPGKADDSAGDACAGVPGPKALGVPAAPEVVGVGVEDDAPADDARRPRKSDE